MITMKDVIREGNQLLKEKSVEVQIPLSKEDEELMISMMEYVYNSCDPEFNEKYDLRPAVGLAAPQVTYLMHELRDCGLPVDLDATTVEEAKRSILEALKK